MACGSISCRPACRQVLPLRKNYDEMTKLLYLFLLLTVCGCATKRVYIPMENLSVRTDTVRAYITRLDTIRERDSVTLVQRGDTVYLTKWLLRERVRERRDTLYRTKTDTVRIRQTVPAAAAPAPGLWQRLKRLASTPVLLLLLLAAGCFLLRRLRRKAC